MKEYFIWSSMNNGVAFTRFTNWFVFSFAVSVFLKPFQSTLQTSCYLTLIFQLVSLLNEKILHLIVPIHFISILSYPKNLICNNLIYSPYTFNYLQNMPLEPEKIQYQVKSHMWWGYLSSPVSFCLEQPPNLFGLSDIDILKHPGQLSCVLCSQHLQPKELF